MSEILFSKIAQQARVDGSSDPPCAVTKGLIGLRPQSLARLPGLNFTYLSTSTSAPADGPVNPAPCGVWLPSLGGGGANSVGGA